MSMMRERIRLRARKTVRIWDLGKTVQTNAAEYRTIISMHKK